MNHTPQGASSRHLWVFGGFAIIAGFFLLTEHRAHVLGILPYLLLAACPLMHLFMHHGHGGHRHGDGRRPRRDEEEGRP
ncbi:DUF2933 domain-containing protein [Pseudomonas sp. BN415]|uniref:DUF2933 domain-containing protein n=1 Tax=Pseudomonas sp. BN415 TaxID=2567889 RepID=UPI0024567C88|nr:DUF2933 domain-containing protein [Pseudomonas sp. BN415]MDH4581590.1 DUF2933 domain-containing protein [Pseudomonas sp. BN415]